MPKNALTVKDLPGMRFGMLTVVRWDHRRNWNNYFLCRCDCGAEIYRRSTQFYYGKFYTCGAERCRFWGGVDKNGPIINRRLGRCHVWTKAVRDDGYGIFHPTPRVSRRVHVYAWELENGSVPEGQWVLHRCDNRRCLRVSHLFLGDHNENMRDMALKGRAARDGKVYLSDAEKQRMITVYNDGQSGIPHHKLAADFGVSLVTVRRTLRGASSRRKQS